MNEHEENLAAIGHPEKNMHDYSLYSDWLASSHHADNGSIILGIGIGPSSLLLLEHMFSTSSFPLVVI